MDDLRNKEQKDYDKIWKRFKYMLKDYDPIELTMLAEIIGASAVDKFLVEIKKTNPAILNEKFKEWLTIIDGRTHDTAINVFMKRMKEWGLTVSSEFKDIEKYGE